MNLVFWVRNRNYGTPNYIAIKIICFGGKRQKLDKENRNTFAHNIMINFHAHDTFCIFAHINISVIIHIIVQRMKKLCARREVL